ncbi:molybdate ABC transporter permease subunit [Edaphobacter bradus]|uniref:molybdate ABC transporter permease subunit n=1 Tax=Edaphobacter bradus TaxID=2259016 RepID=UPI0021DFE3CE|nr:molybdate ABC transporter permease subunit [Edaphobacter bradus]
MDLEALWLTLRLAASTTAILLLVGLPLAWWIASGRGMARAVVQAVVALPLVLPPTVLGFYLLVMLGPLTWPGRVLIHVFGHPLAFSFGGLLVGSVLYSLPFAVQPLVAGFGAVEKGYIEAAAGLGASPMRVFVSVVLPTAGASLLTSAVLTFTHTVGEFGVVLMLGGNIPGLTRTLSISLYDLVQDGNYAAANRTALVLVGFATAALLAIYLLPSVRKVDGRQVDVVR